MIKMTGNGASTARTFTVKNSVTVKKGELLTIQTSDGLVDKTIAGEVCHLVALDESSRDADGTLVTSGATVTAVPVGGVLFVACNGGETWTAADEIFVGADGQATESNASSAKKLGIYLGAAIGTTVDGTLVAVNTNGAEQI